VPIDELADRICIGLRVLPERPADRLSDEELAVAGAQFAVAEESIRIRCLFVAELMEDGGPSEPMLGGFRLKVKANTVSFPRSLRRILLQFTLPAVGEAGFIHVRTG
jgi:hypothetical protein